MTTTAPLTTYTKRDVADMLRLASTNQIDRGVASGELPHLRVGRAIRFTEAHVAQIVSMFEQKPAKEKALRARRRRTDVDLSAVPLAPRSARHHTT